MSLFFDNNQVLPPPGQVYIRSVNNPNEYLFVEIQGEIKSTLSHFHTDDPTSSDKQYLWDQELGTYTEEEDGKTCTLVIGNLKLIGTKERLKKPYLILTKPVPAVISSNINTTSHNSIELKHSGTDSAIVMSEGNDGVTHLTNTNNNTNKMNDLTQNYTDSIIPSSLIDSSLIPSSLEYNNNSGSLDQYDDTASLMGTIVPSSQLTHTMSTNTNISTNNNDNGVKNAHNNDKNEQKTPFDVPIAQSCSEDPLAYKALIVQGVVRYCVKFSKRPIPLVRLDDGTVG